MNDVLYRTAGTLEVRHQQRIIDLIAVPYNEPTDVLRAGRWVTESFDPDAFTGVEGGVTVNRAHNLEDPLGRVDRFHPNDPRGLRTELRISRTRSGDDVLELAADGLLSASVGFIPDSENWSTDRQTVRVTRARLAHIGLTGDPAYKGAKVLAVRAADTDDQSPRPGARPNLDRVRLEMLADRYGIPLPSRST